MQSSGSLQLPIAVPCSYKELMYEAADHGLLQGQWDKQKVNGHVVGNLFDAWKEKMPDIWIANSGSVPVAYGDEHRRSESAT